ncbi:MAG: hypothetical protein Kow00127_16190 [Bacteroidales bacterium]
MKREIDRLKEMTEKLLKHFDERIYNSGNISLLDVDLAMSKVRAIYDLLGYDLRPIVKKAAETKDAAEPGKNAQLVEDEIQSSVAEGHEILNEELLSLEPESPESEEKTAPPGKVVVNDEEPIEERDRPGQKPTVEPDLFSQSAIPEDTAAQTAGAPAGNKAPLAGERIAKVESISAGIGINDKYLFINELFKGSMSVYQEAVSQIDKTDVAEEAEKLMEQWATKYQWDNESEAVKLFRQIVERKFL